MRGVSLEGAAEGRRAGSYRIAEAAIAPCGLCAVRDNILGEIAQLPSIAGMPGPTAVRALTIA